MVQKVTIKSHQNTRMFLKPGKIVGAFASQVNLENSYYSGCVCMNKLITLLQTLAFRLCIDPPAALYTSTKSFAHCAWTCRLLMWRQRLGCEVRMDSAETVF